MSGSANVSSIESLGQLRAALCTFGEKAAEAVLAADAEIQRTVDWLDDQVGYWRHEVRRWEDEVFRARTELSRRRMLKIGDRPPDCTEQEEALERARQALAHAEDQVEATRRWQRLWHEAVIEYGGPVGQFKGLLEGDLPRAIALLERKIESLDAYVGLVAPAVARSGDHVTTGTENRATTAPATAPVAQHEKKETSAP
jgi:hypothetical protein